MFGLSIIYYWNMDPISYDKFADYTFMLNEETN